LADVKIKASVGEGGKNKPADVAIVEDLLNRQRTTTPLVLDGLASADLNTAIRKYQTDVLKSLSPDGRVDAGGGTIAGLLRSAEPSAANGLFGTQRATLGPTTRVATIEDLYKRQFGMSPPGLGVLTRAIIADPNITDIRWAAYMLATAWLETKFTFQPIDEDGKGSGRDYGDGETYTDTKGIKHENVYYGRGYAQITWLKNYLTNGKAIGVDDQLAIDPSKALDPAIAYQLMSQGMRKGTFTGVSFSHYIVGTKCDYFNARRIINGTDRATEIANTAESLEVVLRVAVL